MSNQFPPERSSDEEALAARLHEGEVATPAGEYPVGTTGTAEYPAGTTGTAEYPAGTTGAANRQETAKEQAGRLGEQASDAGHKVAGTAKDEAAKVASEVKTQVGDLFSEAKEELNEQATSQQERVAAGLHSISDELQSMADNSEESGMATDLVRRAAVRAGSVASWLDERDPGSLLGEVRRFAREKPGTFIAIAAAAGVLAGRLTRSVASESSASHGRSTGPSAPRSASPAAPSAGGVGAPIPTGATGPVGSSIDVDPDIQTDPLTPIYDETFDAKDAREQFTEAEFPEGGERR